MTEEDSINDLLVPNWDWALNRMQEGKIVRRLSTTGSTCEEYFRFHGGSGGFEWTLSAAWDSPLKERSWQVYSVDLRIPGYWVRSMYEVVEDV